MRYRSAKALVMLLMLAMLGGCVIHSKKTDRRSPGHARYRHNGRYW